MARDKKTMIGFDPLAWLDNEGEEKAASDQGDETIGKKSDQAVENTTQAEETQVVAKEADKSRESKSKATVKNKVKMIDVLGTQIDEVALLKGYELSISRLDEIMEAFYTDLFEQYPDVKPLFGNVNNSEQSLKLKAAVKLLIENIHNQETLKSALHDLGERHQAYEALPDHYPVVAELLVASFKKVLGRSWTKAVNGAWLALLGMAAKEMCAAYVETIESIDVPEDEIEQNEDLPTETNDTDDNAMIETDQPVLQLHNVQDIGKSQALKNDMLALINDNDEITIAASTVERIDGSALQLLCALFQYSKDNNLVIHWINPSDVVLESATTLGLKKILELN
jgi:hemoglobin-like flavoprotein/anti-anti-sigma regulatory factor